LPPKGFDLEAKALQFGLYTRILWFNTSWTPNWL
jgi:hypothetical protein